MPNLAHCHQTFSKWSQRLSVDANLPIVLSYGALISVGIPEFSLDIGKSHSAVVRKQQLIVAYLLRIFKKLFQVSNLVVKPYFMVAPRYTATDTSLTSRDKDFMQLSDRNDVGIFLQ